MVKQIKIDYSGEAPEIAVRVQEMFGVKTHPTVGPRRLPLRVTLLSPARRPVRCPRARPRSPGQVRRCVAMWSGATTYQYAKTFQSDRAIGAILRTFRISVLSVIFCLLISYPIALWLPAASRAMRTAILLITFIYM